MTIGRNVSILRAGLLGGALLLTAAVPAFAASPNTLPVTLPGTSPATTINSLLPAAQNANTNSLVSQLSLGTVLAQPTSPVNLGGGPAHSPGGFGMPDIAVTNAGPSPEGFDRFTVANIGNIPAETFHVAVIALTNSYGFDIPYMYPNESKTYTLPFNDCGTGAVILANTGNVVKESNYNNDALVLHGICQIDDGPVLVPASN